jgi:VWFA-related protein
MRVGLHRLTVKQQSAPGYRQVMIVLTDGDDTGSRSSFEDLVADVRHSNVLIYVLSLRPRENRQLPPPVWQMLQLARDSGGRALSVGDGADLTKAYREIGQELRQFYRLAYIPREPPPAGDWRAIAVRFPGKDIVARTRPGYFASRRAPAQGR